MTTHYHYKRSGRFWGVFDHADKMVDAFLYEDNARLATDFKNAREMTELERHNATFAARKAIERLLADEKLSEAADAAVLLTKGTGIVEIKNDKSHIVYALVFNGRHTARLNRKSKPRFSPLCMIGEELDSPVLDQVRLFNARFGK